MIAYPEDVADRPSLEVPEATPAGPGERCDRCGAEAQYRVQLRTGDLTFCGHHHRKYGPALASVVAVPSSL